jgi:spermidine synthase
LTALAFLPLGQACGFFLDTIDSLQAYSVDLIGSLVGILCMFVLSAFWMPPVIWFAIVFAAFFPFIASGKRPVLIVSAVFFFSIVFLGWSQSTHPFAVTSPYQQLELRSIGHGQFDLIAAGHYHQRILNLSDANLKNPTERVNIAARNYYDFPYSLAPDAKQIAIVGAGTGNDVAAAIRKSSAHIDAIEIDPAILDFGRLFHPEDPYRNKAVTPVIDDARHFLKTHPDRFDLIIFGLLDSHTLLSHVNNVRLESYVYTVEAFKEARQSLRKGGVLTIAFTVLAPSLGRKIYLMLKKAFDGIPPLCLRTAYDKAIIFVAGKNGPPHLSQTKLAALHFINVSKKLADLRKSVNLSTDDWPFFYMPKRVYPISYLPLALIVLVVCFGIGKLCKVEKPNVRQMVFFCLGCGFMLIETKAIAELALFFGNTWHVVGITIAAILVMVFLANYCIRILGKFPVTICLILVLISLMAAFFVKDMTIINKGLDPYAKTIIITLPMFFAGLAFSSLLSGAKEFSKLMGANLIGAMIGGLLEYNAMYFGYNALNIFAAVLYGGALLFIWWDKKRDRALDS